MNRKAVLRKRRRRTFRFLALFAAVLLLYIWGSHVSAFNIKRITVSGAFSASNDEILAASGVSEGVNALAVLGRQPLGIPLLRMFDAETKLKKAFPCIKKVSAVYFPNGTVSIKITEKDPAYRIPYDGTFYLIDAEGTILGPAHLRADINPPLLVGLDTEGRVPGDNISETNSNKFIALGTLKNSVSKISEVDKYDLGAIITGYDISDLFALRFYVRDEITAVIGSTEDIDYKLRLFIASYKAELEGKKGTFTVNPDLKANFIFK